MFASQHTQLMVLDEHMAWVATKDTGTVVSPKAMYFMQVNSRQSPNILKSSVVLKCIDTHHQCTQNTQGALFSQVTWIAVSLDRSTARDQTFRSPVPLN